MNFKGILSHCLESASDAEGLLRCGFVQPSHIPDLQWEEFRNTMVFKFSLCILSGQRPLSKAIACIDYLVATGRSETVYEVLGSEAADVVMRRGSYCHPNPRFLHLRDDQEAVKNVVRSYGALPEGNRAASRGRIRPTSPTSLLNLALRHANLHRAALPSDAGLRHLLPEEIYAQINPLSSYYP